MLPSRDLWTRNALENGALDSALFEDVLHGSSAIMLEECMSNSTRVYNWAGYVNPTRRWRSTKTSGSKEEEKLATSCKICVNYSLSNAGALSTLIAPLADTSKHTWLQVIQRVGVNSFIDNMDPNFSGTTTFLINYEPCQYC